MRVLACISNVWYPAIKISGAYAYYLQQKSLVNKGIEVHILTAPGLWDDPKRWLSFSYDSSWFKKEEKSSGVKFHLVNTKLISIKHFGYLFYKILLLFNIIQLHKKYNFDLIHDYYSNSFLSVRGFILSKLLNVKSVSTICSLGKGFLNNPLWYILFKQDKIILSSKSLIDKLNNFKHKINYDFLPFSVEIKKIKNYKQKKVVYVGPLLDRKGYIDFVKSYILVKKKIKNVKFVMYTSRFNDKDYAKKVYQIKSFLGDDKNFIIKEGVFTKKEMFNNSLLYVHTQTESHGTVSYPLTLLEAMSYGVPIISTNLDEIKEIKSKGILFFKKSDFVDLSKKIIFLLRDKKIINKMSDDNLKFIKRFDVNKLSKNLIKIYNGVLND